MRLFVKRDSEKLVLHIRNNDDELLSDIVYWSFSDLKKSIVKMSSLFVVSASSEKRNDIEYFHYNKATIYHNLQFESFLQLIEDGSIMFDLRMGVYKSGKSKGKPHDHGSGFRLNRDQIRRLYKEVIEIE